MFWGYVKHTCQFAYNSWHEMQQVAIFVLIRNNIGDLNDIIKVVMIDDRDYACC